MWFFCEGPCDVDCTTCNCYFFFPANVFTFQIDGDYCFDIWPSPMIQNAVGIFVIFVDFLVPLVILVYCYGRILWVIRARIGSKMGTDDAQTAKFEQARNNVIKTLFLVAFFFVICFLGSEVHYIFYGLGFEVKWSGGLYNFTVSMLFLNCTINPFIYLINYKDFQKALMRQLCCRISRQHITGNTISESIGPQNNGLM